MSKRINIALKKESIVKLFPHLVTAPITTTQELAMFKSGAKLYKASWPGIWTISGYDNRGDDVQKALAEIISIL